MNPPDEKKHDDALKEKLEELEALLDREDAGYTPNRIEVPVLDELVTEADLIGGEDENDIEKIEEQIVDLAEKLEHSFSGELDQLVELLKSNLRDSIIRELRHQANLDNEKPPEGEAEEKDV